MELQHSTLVFTQVLVAVKCNAERCNYILVGVCSQDLEVQQPWNVGLGVSMDMGNNLLLWLMLHTKHGQMLNSSMNFMMIKRCLCRCTKNYG